MVCGLSPMCPRFATSKFLSESVCHFLQPKKPNSQKESASWSRGSRVQTSLKKTRRLVRGFHFHQAIYKVDEPWLILTKLKWHNLKHDPPSSNNNNNNNNNRQLHPNRFAGAPTVTSGLNFSKAPKTTSSSKALAKAKPKSTQRLRFRHPAAKRWWWHRCVTGPLGLSLPAFCWLGLVVVGLLEFVVWVFWGRRKMEGEIL